MRVLSIGSLYPPHHFGGYEVIWRSAVDELRRRGHVVRVLASDHRHPGGPVGGEPDGADVHRELRWYWREGAWPAIGLRERVAIERHNARSLRRHLRALDPDVVLWSEMGGMSLSLIEHVHRAGTPALGIVLDGWLVYAPTVDAWTRAWRRRPVLAHAAERLSGVPTRPRLDRAAEWTFCSAFLREDTERRMGTRLPRTSVVHPGIEPALFTWREDQPWHGRLAYVGRVVPDKGLGTLVDAVGRLPDTTLTVTGPGDPAYLAELRERAQRCGAGGRVAFEAAVERPRLAECYGAADAVVFPVEWDEPFGLVPLEAMAVGRPVVATGTGGSGEYLRDGTNALLFAAGDAAALAGAVSRLAGDPDLRAQLREGGRRTASRFTASVYDQAVAQALERIASAGGGARSDPDRG